MVFVVKLGVCALGVVTEKSNYYQPLLPKTKQNNGKKNKDTKAAHLA